MLFTPLMVGAGIKIVSNVINNWMHNSNEERQSNTSLDADTLKARVELAKAQNKNLTSSLVRGFIFIILTSTWCYLAIYGIHNPEKTYDVLLPKGNNWSFGSLISSSQWEIKKLSASVLLFQWFQLMEMILGFYVVPSRRR